MYNYFNDKVIWITGASSGIGEAISKYLLQNTNAHLVLSARNIDKLKSITNQTPSSRILILPFDLSENFNADNLVQSIIQQFRKIDILISNGGISQRAMALETAESIERKLFEINYFSCVKLSKAVLPYMIEQKFGHIVVMSSIAGKFGFYLRSSYSAAKHALHGYFESLRLEYEKNGIFVTIVCPGKIKTNISLNAVSAGGSMHNRMDESHQNAMPANVAAKIILRNMTRKKEEIFVGRKEILMVYFKKFCPLFFNWIIRKQSPY